MIRIGVFAVCCWVAPLFGVASADDLLLRLYLTDGTSVVSCGEYARLGDRVMFSMVIGGDTEPRQQEGPEPDELRDFFEFPRLQ